MFLAWPAWKYGARDGEPAQAEHAHLADVRPQPGVERAAELRRLADLAVLRLRTVSSGKKSARLDSAATPMSMKRTLVDEPTFLARWQPLQVVVRTGMPISSFRPATPETWNCSR